MNKRLKKKYNIDRYKDIVGMTITYNFQLLKKEGFLFIMGVKGVLNERDNKRRNKIINDWHKKNHIPKYIPKRIKKELIKYMEWYCVPTSDILALNQTYTSFL